MKTLMLCPPGKTNTYIIPDGVETIADSAFSRCTLLSEIVTRESIIYWK